MPAEIILQQTPEAALLHKRELLASVRTSLAERESELAQLRAQSRTFEGRYLRQVGILYAQLNDVADLYDSDTARRHAEESRRTRAQETHDAAFGDAREAEEFDPPHSLKTLFRDVAKRIHPDFARDDAEQKHLTLLMARANQAYSRGDIEALQRIPGIAKSTEPASLLPRYLIWS